MKGGGGAYFVAYVAADGDFHCDDLAGQAGVKDRSEIAELALAAQQAWEMHHFVLWRRVLAVSGFLVCVHGSGWWGGGKVSGCGMSGEVWGSGQRGREAGGFEH